MTEYEACVAAGLDLWRWEQPEAYDEDGHLISGYPMWFRANVLAWHRMRELKRTHSDDAVSTHMEKQRKQRGNK